LGLLIEEQRSNLLTYSEQFDNVVWTKTRASITANTIVSPDGTLDGDKLVEDTSVTASHLIQLQGSFNTFVSGTSYALSIYLKAAGRSVFEIGFGVDGGIFSGQFSTFTLSGSGSVVNSGSITSTITSVGNGWYRVTATATAQANGGGVIRGVLSNGSTTLYTGDGYSGIYIWGAQLEAGAFPTSYIPTAASQVTRSNDAASMTGTNFSSWFRQDEGTMFGQAVRFASGSLPTAIMFQVDDGTTSNRSTVAIAANGSVNNSTSLTQVASVTQANAGFTASAINKMAYAYKTNDFATSFNGSAPTLDTSGILPLVTQARIGTNGGSFYNGHIQRIAYYPIRLSDTNLQALTT
jgi:hypothetical protein